MRIVASRVRSLVLAAAVFSVVGASAFAISAAALPSAALFVGQRFVPTNGLSTGKLVLGAAPSTALLTASALKPGDVVTGSLVVANSGSLSLRYAMTTATTNADGKGLASSLILLVHDQGTSCAAFDGSELYNGPLAGAAIGDPTTGLQVADRSLAVGGSETLCFRVQVPVSLGTSGQNATTTATFTFTGEQEVNNP